MLEDSIYNLSLKSRSHILDTKVTIDLYIWTFFIMEYNIVCVNDLCLGFMDECFFIIASHLLPIWCIDDTIYKVESEKCSFSFFSFVSVFFLEGSFLNSLDRLFLRYSDMDSDRLIK